MNVLKETGRNTQLILRSDPTHPSSGTTDHNSCSLSDKQQITLDSSLGRDTEAGAVSDGYTRVGCPMIDTVIDYNISKQ